MYRYLFFVLLSMLFVCACKHTVQKATALNKKDSIPNKEVQQIIDSSEHAHVVAHNTQKAPLDTSIILFDDKNCSIKLHKFDDENDYDEAKPNTTLTFTRLGKIVFRE